MHDTSLNEGVWYTCTPVRFVGDHTFFARDSGLLCKGFQEAGYRCKVIMPGPAMDVDNTEDLIRTDYSNLENPDWWKTLRAQGVVLYAWGDGRYWRIARAIRLSGAKLLTHMDTAGILGITNGVCVFTKTLWYLSSSTYGSGIKALIHTGMRLLYASTIGLVRNDYRRALHLNHADVIGAISPIAAARIRKVCDFYGGNDMASKIRLIPHPNASYMRYDSRTCKERMICAVGRWDDQVIKGTDLLCETCELITKKDNGARIEIYGQVPESMQHWHQALDEDIQGRIIIKGVVSNRELRQALQRARISLCTSLREGYHTVSAEALCCGCSVVGPDVESIPSLKWFTDGPYGALSPRKAESMAKCIIDELKKWDSGERDPVSISEMWTSRLHAPNIARQIIDLVRD